MWRLEKDPVPLVDVRHASRSSTGRRTSTACGRGWSGPSWTCPGCGWRVQPAPVNLSAPMWVDDPDFDIDHHVRRIALPKPGIDAPAARPGHADRRSTRSSAPGRCGSSSSSRACAAARRRCVQKMHHTITDGEGGVQMSLQYLDFERDAPEPPPLDPATIEAAGRRRRRRRPLDTLRDLLARRVPAADRRRPPGPRAARRPGGDPGAPARRPSTRCAASSPSSPTSSGPARRCGPSARCGGGRGRAGAVPGRPRTRPSASAARSTRRSSPPPPRPPARYHRELGAPVEQLRASMAISTRTGRLRRQRLLAGPDDGADRRDADRRALRARSRRSPTRPGTRPAAPRWQTLAAVAAALPTSLVTRLARQQAQTVDFATSNVRGSPVPVYIGGAQLLRELPDRARWPAWRSTSRCCRTSAASTWASTSTPPRSPSRSGWRRPRAGVQGPRARLTRAGRQTSLDGRLGGRRGEHRAHVEQQVGDLVRRHQLAAQHLAERLVDHGEGLGDHGVVRFGCRAIELFGHPRHGTCRPAVALVERTGDASRSSQRHALAGSPTIAAMDLQDRHVVVTGAARGIGAALARRFHAEGARVVVADLDGVADGRRRAAPTGRRRRRRRRRPRPATSR